MILYFRLTEFTISSQALLKNFLLIVRVAAIHKPQEEKTLSICPSFDQPPKTTDLSMRVRWVWPNVTIESPNLHPGH